MIVYRGATTENFSIIGSMSSRYGFPALFFTTSIELARTYAKYYAKEYKLRTGGFVYQYDLPDTITSYNYNYKSSKSYIFRNLIFQFKRERHPAVIIKNVFDYPSEDFPELIFSDLVVVFSFHLVMNQKLIEHNLT